jgi:dipeptidyl aminopeptidase/acylaminoacyl peptidase
MRTVRELDHLRRAVLVAAAAGLLAAVALLVVVFYAQPAGATFPGTPGRITYAHYDGNDTEIFTIKPDGTGRVQVTHNGVGDGAPSYSPDGERIAFGSSDGDDYEIFTIKASGGGKRQLTHNNTDDSSPSWGIR